MRFPENGVPELGLINGCVKAEKSPTRCAGVGTNTSEKNTPGASSTVPEKSSFGELGKGIDWSAGNNASFVYPRTSIFPLGSAAVSFAMELNGMRPGGKAIDSARDRKAEKQNAISSNDLFMMA